MHQIITTFAGRARRLAARLAAALLLLLAVGALRAQADDSALRVFVFAGQSNMVGSDSKAKDIALFPPFAGLDQPQPAVQFWYCLGREDKRKSDGWVALQPVDEVVGPELSFARIVTQHTKAKVAIIKIAAGGTHLAGDWNPDEPSGFKLYPLALDTVRAALADLDRQHIAYRLEGFVWHQGENDMFDAGYRAAYAKNLANFIAHWRRDLGAPKLPFYLGELCTKTIWGMDNRANMDAITQAQRAVVAADPLVHFVPTSHVGVEIGGDAGLHYHYGTLGQLEHGASHAAAYLRTLGVELQAARPLAAWPYAKGSAVKLFVLAGHRNMEGERAFVQQLPQDSPLLRDNAKIAFRYSLGGAYTVSAGWEPLGPAGFHDTFGPELSFGAALASKLPGNFAIAKFTHSGSQINDWTPAGSEAKARNLYPAFLAFVRDAMQDLTARGHTVELAGIFYHLGENDLAFGSYRKAAVARLATLVQQSRVDLGLPELTWYVSQQPPAHEKGLDKIDVTADLQKLAASDPHLIHLRAFDLPGQEQQLVITTAGIVQLGEVLAAGYLQRR